MKWLELVAKQHDDWVLMAQKMGAKSYSKDICRAPADRKSVV